MNVILAQAQKEWAEFVRDKLGLALAFLLPLATLLLFGFGVRLKATNIPVIVQDLDNSSISRAYVERIYSSRLARPALWNGVENPETAIQRGEAKAAIIIPHGFSRHIDLHENAQVQTLIDGSDISTAQVIRSLSRLANASFNRDNLPVDRNRLYVMPQLRIEYNPDLKESAFIVPAVFGIILWMYPALLAAVAVAREADHGTLVQLRSSGLSIWQAMIGKALVYFGVGVMETLVILGFAYIVFGEFLHGLPLAFVVATALYVAASVCFGFTIGSFIPAQTVAVQATATAGFFPSLLLSGFVYPISNMPPVISWACLFVPATYYIEICRDAFLRGGDTQQTVCGCLALLAAMALLFCSAAAGMKRLLENA